MPEKLQRNLWLLVIPILLLATGLASSQLNDRPFDVDEMVSMRTAGARHFGPYSLAKAWSRVSERFADQAHGFALLYLIWGRIFGWSEFAIRLLPFFAGLTALAWSYRVGRVLYSPLTGLVAAVLLSSSVFYITYMHVARPYALVALFTLMIMWSYYRINILRPMGRRSNFEQICFLIAGVGICYTHYFSALLIVALALWHFLFMLRKRSWWRQTSLFILIAILSLPQLNGFLGGISTTQTAWHFTDENMMRFSEILPWFFYVLTNGIVSTPSTFVMVLAVTLFLACTGIRKKLWLDNEFHRIWLLPFITLTLLFLILMSNEIVLVFRQERLRYFMVMWPLVALSVGCVVHRTRALLRFITILMTITYFAVGFMANVASELRYEFYDLLIHIPVHIAHNIVEKNSSARDLLLFDHTLDFPREFYFRPLPYDRIEIRSPDHGQMELSSEAEKYLRIWLLADVANSELYRTLTINLANELVHCDRYLDRKNLVLELYAWSAVYCPSEKTERMLFGEDIELAASVVEVVSEETLQIELLLHSDKANRMAAFSIALHVFDVESGAKVAQGDQGLWLGRYNPLRSEIDISGLTAGEYELRVGIYNWQTLERLEGVDLTSGATAVLLTLYRFRVE